MFRCLNVYESPAIYHCNHCIVEMRGNVWQLKNRCTSILLTSLVSCTNIYKTSSRSIVQRDFSIFEETNKFNYGRHARKCIKQTVDSREWPKWVRRLWLPTICMLKTCWGGRTHASEKHITSQPWSQANCSCTTCTSDIRPLVTLFLSERTKQSTGSDGTTRGSVRPWLTRAIV